MIANVAATTEEAVDLNQEIAALISEEVGIQFLSSAVKEDMSRYPLEGPMPDLFAEAEGVTSIRKSIYEMAVRENLAVRQTYRRLIAGDGRAPFSGSAVDVIDQMEEWFESGSCDGFMVDWPTTPLGLERFVDLAVPELQRRCLFHTDYTGATLRDEVGLAIPADPYFV